MPFFKAVRRYLAARRPLSGPVKNLLPGSVPFYKYLNVDQKALLEKRMNVFLEEKLFEGCAGLTITDEMKCVIAAYACLLILEEPSGYYPELSVVLVYPDDYVAPVYMEDSNGVVTEGHERRQGESWDSGSVVLSWRDVLESTLRSGNTHNLVIHEFAHQLDDQYGLSAGIDDHGAPTGGDAWTRELAAIYRDLLDAERRGNQLLPLDLYGATSPAECFAVVMEAFIEDPRKLQFRYGAAYRHLTDFFGFDPGRIWGYRK